MFPSNLEDATAGDDGDNTGERGPDDSADRGGRDLEGGGDSNGSRSRSVGDPLCSARTAKATAAASATVAVAEGGPEGLKKTIVPPMLLLSAIPEAVMCQLVLAGWERSSVENNE